MTKEEKIIVSAYTGYLMCDWDDMHQYIEKKLGRPVWTHELAFEEMQEKIREVVKDDFLALCNEEEEEEELDFIQPHKKTPVNLIINNKKEE